MRTAIEIRDRIRVEALETFTLGGRPLLMQFTFSFCPHFILLHTTRLSRWGEGQGKGLKPVFIIERVKIRLCASLWATSLEYVSNLRLICSNLARSRGCESPDTRAFGSVRPGNQAFNAAPVASHSLATNAAFTTCLLGERLAFSVFVGDAVGDVLDLVVSVMLSRLAEIPATLDACCQDWG